MVIVKCFLYLCKKIKNKKMNNGFLQLPSDIIAMIFARCNIVFFYSVLTVC